MTEEKPDRIAEAAAFLAGGEDAVSPQRRAEVAALGEQIIDVLKTVYDPEIPVNIYELGLIYKIDVDDDDIVQIDMTLTSPMCPVAETLPPEVERKVASVEGVNACTVQVVWDPPWNPQMMTEEAQLELGLVY